MNVRLSINQIDFYSSCVIKFIDEGYIYWLNVSQYLHYIFFSGKILDGASKMNALGEKFAGS
jgi:hypothetical protein